MNDTAITVLTICLAILIVMALILIAFGIFMLVIWIKIRRSVRTLRRTSSTTPDLNYLETLKLQAQGVPLSESEVNDIRTLLRRRKETEARDQDTIDKATEFNRDF